MSIVDDKVSQIVADADILHQVAQGDKTVTVPVTGGILKSLAKWFADNQLIIDAIPPSLASFQAKSEKDSAGGYVGLSGNKINVKNVLGTIISTLVSSATGARNYVLQDKSGVIAHLDDITGDNTGKNTGDETKQTILDKLQITQLSGVNTGDQTLDSLGAQARLLYVPADAGSIGQANGITPLGPDAKVPAIYLPSFVDDVMEFDTFALLPFPGERGKIYVATNDNSQYRWSGSSYIQLVSSPGTTDSIAEGSGSLYFTEARVLATVLNGLSNAAANLPIAVADTVLGALAKLQAQITANVATIATLAPLDSPSLTGNVTVPTVALGDNSTLASSTAFVQGTLNVALNTVVTSKLGQANGIATLGSDAKIPAAFLPSYVDDVLEYANLAALPAIGESGKIYIALDTNFEYRWSGSLYIRLVSSPGTTDALAEGAVNKYFTTARVLATALAGFVLTDSTAVTVADTIIAAFGKLQAQMNAVVSSYAQKVNAIFTSNVTVNADQVKASYSTISSLDLAADVVIFTANHAFVSGDYVLYLSTSTGMNVGGNVQQNALFYVFAKAADRVTLHSNAVDAATGANPLDIQANGSGTQTMGHATRAQIWKTSSVGNGNAIEMYSYRYALAATWQSMATRIQSKVDAIVQAYMEFNPPGNNGGMKFFAWNPGKFQFQVDSSFVQLTIDQAGVKAAGDLQLNGVSVMTVNMFGIANGVAQLGADSKLPAIYLPSYVDDVLEYATVAAFPAVGETGKIYVNLDFNKTYRWSGSVYVEISASPGSTDAVSEGVTNKYFTTARVLTTALAGLVTNVGGVITVADTVLSALGKLQNQVTAIPYDISGGMNGKPAQNDSAILHLVIRPFTIPAGAALSRAVAGTAPTGTFVYGLQKNGNSFGSITFAASQAVPVLNIPSATSFVAGDVIKLVALSAADATLADLSVTLATTLN